MTTPANPRKIADTHKRPSWAEYERAGLTLEEYAEDRHAAYLAGMTTWQSFQRWWWMNWPGVLTIAVLLAIVAVLAWVEYA